MLDRLPWSYQSLIEKRMHQRKQEVRILSGFDEVMFVSLLRSARAVWIYYYDFASSLA